jgi:hypothetical protein
MQEHGHFIPLPTGSAYESDFNMPTDLSATHLDLLRSVALLLDRGCSNIK